VPWFQPGQTRRAGGRRVRVRDSVDRADETYFTKLSREPGDVELNPLIRQGILYVRNATARSKVVYYPHAEGGKFDELPGIDPADNDTAALFFVSGAQFEELDQAARLDLLRRGHALSLRWFKWDLRCE
jgi:hypothetical protein